jgi:hypothetical protein
VKVGDMVRVIEDRTGDKRNNKIGLVVRVEWGGRCSRAWHARNNGLDGKGAWRQQYAYVRFLEENDGWEWDPICEDRLEVLSETR